MPVHNIPFIFYQESDLTYLKLWIIGVIISAMAYGCVLFLSLAYISLLLKTSGDISRRIKFVLAYVIFMVAVSTVYMITIIIAFTRNLSIDPFNAGPNQLPEATSSRYLFPNGLVGAVCTALASWGGDGFMLWRCAMLYEGVSRPRRISLLVLLVFMALLSLGSGLLIITYGSIATPVFFGVTLILNFVVATLNTLRILHFGKCIQKTIGTQRNSPEMNIFIFYVESPALFIVFNLIYFALLFEHTSVSVIPMQSLVHAYVISSLLILYRVAQGKAITTKPRSSDGPVVSELHFESQ